MRTLAVIAVCAIGCLLWTPPAARAQGAPKIAVRADRVAFFSDRFLLAARDHVTVRLSRRSTIKADALGYDLFHNTLTAAGHVRYTVDQTTYDAAAVAIDLTHSTTYVLTLDPLPDTVKIVNERVADATHAAAPPGTFAPPASDGTRPWMRGTHAVVTQNVAVDFTPAHFPTGAGIDVPSPHFTFIFAASPNYTSNNLPAASFDQPYPLLTGPHSADLLHFRYDPTLGGTLAFDHHLVFGDTTYLIASVAPLDRPAKTALLNFSQKMGAKLNHTLSMSYNTWESGFAPPLYASLQTQYTISWALRTSYLQFQATQQNNSLLPPPVNGSYYRDPSHTWDPSHPFFGELQWNSYSLPFFRRFSAQFQSAFGVAYNGSGVIPPANDSVLYRTVWHHTLGGTMTTPLVKIGNSASLITSVNATRIWYSYPHRNTTAGWTSTLSKKVNKAINLIAGYSLTNVSDNYGARQGAFYPPQPTPPPPLPPIIGYTGATTTRVYSANAYYNPSAFFNLSVGFAHTVAFPQNSPTYSASFDLRARPVPSLAFEIGRSYYFNWYTQGWSPQWTFSISP